LSVITCSKCQEELLYAIDSGGEEIVSFKVQCVCGKEIIETFIGYPKLSGNDKYYFEFIDENKIMCKPRVFYKRKI